MAELLNEFHALRIKNMETLNSISTHQLDMQAQHPELGQANLRELIACWVAHDLSHINQITRVLARNYTNQVGPWKKYMTLLQ